MTINVLGIVLIVIFAGLAWWANETLNKVPTLKPIIQVIIVVVAVVLLLQSVGLIGGPTVVIR